MSKHYCRLLQVERFFRQSRMLLRQSRTLLRYCCRLATMSNEFFVKISSFRQSRNKLNMFNLFWLCRKDEISFDIVAENCSNAVTTFDFVEIIARIVTFNNVAATLLLVWTELNGVFISCGAFTATCAITHLVGTAPGPFQKFWNLWTKKWQISAQESHSVDRPGQLSLLPSVGREMSTGQSAVMLCSWE